LTPRRRPGDACPARGGPAPREVKVLLKKEAALRGDLAISVILLGRPYRATPVWNLITQFWEKAVTSRCGRPRLAGRAVSENRRPGLT